MGEEDPGRAMPLHAAPYGPAWTCKDFRRISVICDVPSAILERIVAPTPFVLTGSRIEVFHDDLSGHSLGSFNESGICIPVAYEGVRGVMHGVIFVTSDVALIAGREVFGYPKLGGEVEYREDGNLAEAVTRRGGQRIMSVSFEVNGAEVSVGDMVPTADGPADGEWEWTHHLLLKSVPRPERRGADVYSVVYRNIGARPSRILPGVAEVEIADVPELPGLSVAKPVAAYLITGDFGEGWDEDRRVLRSTEDVEAALA